MFWKKKKKIESEDFSVEVSIGDNSRSGISEFNVVFIEGTPEKSLLDKDVNKKMNDNSDLIQQIKSKNNSPFIKIKEIQLRKKIYITVLNSIKQGHDIKTVKDRLRVFLPSDDKTIDSIARTEVSYLYHRKVILMALSSNALKKEWQSLDLKDTCTNCISLNNKTIDIRENFKNIVIHPPLHENCRCGIRIIYPEEFE